jgi:hypothetical protein
MPAVVHTPFSNVQELVDMGKRIEACYRSAECSRSALGMEQEAYNDRVSQIIQTYKSRRIGAVVLMVSTGSFLKDAVMDRRGHVDVLEQTKLFALLKVRITRISYLKSTPRSDFVLAQSWLLSLTIYGLNQPKELLRMHA